MSHNRVLFVPVVLLSTIVILGSSIMILGSMPPRVAARVGTAGSAPRRDAAHPGGAPLQAPQDGSSTADLVAPPPAVLKSLRKEVGLAMAAGRTEVRDARLRRALQELGQYDLHFDHDPALAASFLPLQVIAHAALNEEESSRRAIARLYRSYAELHGPLAYTRWVEEQVQHYRDPRNYELAVWHTQEAIKHVPEPLRGQAALFVGDIWTQEGRETGSYAKAIEQYDRVARQYQATFRDIADMALFRKAKALWWSGRYKESRAIFEQLGASGDAVVRELAEHYQQLSDIKYAGPPHPAAPVRRDPQGGGEQ